MSAARPRSRALKAISFIASTVWTIPACFVTSMCLIVPSLRNFCFSAVSLAFMGVVLTVVSFWLMCGLLRIGPQTQTATAGRYGVHCLACEGHPPLPAGVADVGAYCAV